jgi:hypothetical protein
VGDHPRLTTGPIKVWEPSMLEWIPIVIVAVDECAGSS